MGSFKGTGKLYAPTKHLEDVARTQPIDEAVGEGRLYSHPDTMGSVAAGSKQGGGVAESSREVAAEVKSALLVMKETVMEKLAALPLPAEALEAGRKSMESLVREVTHTYDNAKEAVQRTKHRIAETIMPPNPAKEAGQVAEEVDRTVLENAEGHVPETHHSKAYHDLHVSTGTPAQDRIKSRL